MWFFKETFAEILGSVFYRKNYDAFFLYSPSLFASLLLIILFEGQALKVKNFGADFLIALYDFWL